VIRAAAVGDIHVAADTAGRLRPHLDELAGDLDVLLLAGDLTRRGDPEEARVLAGELRGLPIPVVAVLGNHDYHLDAEARVRAELEEVGVRVLEGDAAVVEIRGLRLGIAGVKGFGGGFAGACATEFGEPEMKAFVAVTRQSAGALERALGSLDTESRIALVHYAPVESTLIGERIGVRPFLGSYLLAEAVDRAGADVILHGHAHAGSPSGATPGGIPVYNVAQPVIGVPFRVLEIEPGRVAVSPDGRDTVGAS
jgi:Icc-related predicted phosphoesterase